MLMDRLDNVSTAADAESGTPDLEPIAPERVAAARQAFVARRVQLSQARMLLRRATPRPGDLVLAKVRTLGHHQRLQLTSGRRARLFPGDEIIVAYGHRYAPMQFEALVPSTLGPCHLVASGGVAAHAITWHRQILAPTEITPVGLLANGLGEPINLRDAGLPRETSGRRPRAVIAVAGTAMNAGKTTSAAYLIRGLKRAGLAVGSAKMTGTGACNDVDYMRDAGASIVLDFTDAGFVSTYRLEPEQVIDIGATLLNELSRAAVDVAVVEIADGLAQRETQALLESAWSRTAFDSVIFCAGDALAARAGTDWLEARGHRVLCVSGVLTAAPLSMRETEAMKPGVPVVDLAGLSDPVAAGRLLNQLRSVAA